MEILNKIVFEESDANPNKDIEIVINIVYDGSTHFLRNFIITNYPVEYIFFDDISETQYVKYSFKTDEKITTQTFIEALEDETKYIELSLKLHCESIPEKFKDVDFNKINKNFKVIDTFNKEDLEDHINKIFHRIPASGTFEKQRLYNLKKFMDSTWEEKTIMDIEYYDCVKVKLFPDRTIIFHKEI